MNHPQRRSSDQLVGPMFVVGVICFLIAGAIALLTVWKGASFSTPIVIVIAVFAVIGGLLMPTDRVLRGLRIWRRNGDPPSGSTGVSG